MVIWLYGYMVIYMYSNIVADAHALYSRAMSHSSITPGS